MKFSIIAVAAAAAAIFGQASPVPQDSTAVSPREALAGRWPCSDHPALFHRLPPQLAAVPVPPH